VSLEEELRLLPVTPSATQQFLAAIHEPLIGTRPTTSATIGE
jgi:hypothetical protein